MWGSTTTTPAHCIGPNFALVGAKLQRLHNQITDTWPSNHLEPSELRSHSVCRLLSHGGIVTQKSTKMPSDDYASIARGPLKLKGSKVTKQKKKSKKEKEKVSSDAERALTTAVDDDVEKKRRRENEGEGGELGNDTTAADERASGAEEEDDTKTEAERRFAEAKRKRVCLSSPLDWNLLGALADIMTVERVDRVWEGTTRVTQDAQGAR